jgi:hypothetical protein
MTRVDCLPKSETTTMLKSTEIGEFTSKQIAGSTIINIIIRKLAVSFTFAPYHSAVAVPSAPYEGRHLLQ